MISYTASRQRIELADALPTVSPSDQPSLEGNLSILFPFLASYKHPANRCVPFCQTCATRILGLALSPRGTTENGSCKGSKVLANALYRPPLGLFTLRIGHSSAPHLERRPNSSRNTFSFRISCIASATVLLVSCLFNALLQRYRYVLPHLQLPRKSCAPVWMPTAVYHHDTLRHTPATSLKPIIVAVTIPDTY